MGIKRSPGCSCCSPTGCDILTEGRQFIAGPVSKSLGTSADNSILQIVLDQFEDPGPLSWTGTQWTSYGDPPIAWIDGEAINGKDGWSGTDAKIVTVDSVLRAGTTFGTVAYMSRTVEANGEWTYDWQTKVDTAWVQVWVNAVQVASHSENGTGYNTETIQLEAGDTIQFRIYSPVSDDEASVGDITATAYAAAPSPGYNGDTIDLVVGADTLTFGIEDVRTYTAADPSACPPVGESTVFDRRFYVTDGTRKFIMYRTETEYLGENKADQDDVWTPLDFPSIKFRDGVIEVECGAEVFGGGYNEAGTVTYSDGTSGWIPYSIDHDGDTMTLSQSGNLMVDSISHSYVEADCDCNCTPFKPECPSQYTCATVAPHAVVPYGHSLTLPSITLSPFTQEQFYFCTSETTWGVTEGVDEPDAVYYGVDQLDISATYRHDSLVGYFTDRPDTVSERIDNSCSGFACDSFISYTIERAEVSYPQDGQWLTGPLAVNTNLISLDCGNEANCPAYEVSTLVSETYFGCPDLTLNPVGGCTGSEDPFDFDTYTETFTGTDSCNDRRVSTFSGTWTPESHAQRAETSIVSELDVKFSISLPDVANSWRGDRVYGDDPDGLFGGGIWEKSQGDAWVYKRQHYIPVLTYNPDPSNELNDLIAGMVGADQAYYYDAPSSGGSACSDWGGTPPAFTSEDWTGYLPGSLGPQTTFYTTGSINVIISAITGWCGSETTANNGLTEWFEWTAEKDCEVVIDWNHTQADQFFYFLVNGNYVDFSTYGFIGNGSTTLSCVQAGDVVRCEIWTGATAATGIYVRGITVNEVAGSGGEVVSYKIEPDGTAPVEVTDDPHPWVKPEVQFGMAGKVAVSYADTDAVDETVVLSVPGFTICSPPWDCELPLPPGVTDHDDPRLCGEYIKQEDFTTIPPTVIEIGTDDGTWSDALAACTVDPYLLYPFQGPDQGTEWFDTATKNTVSVTRLDTGNVEGCFAIGVACVHGYTTTTGNVYYWVCTDLWDRQIEMETKDTTHRWWTSTATYLYGSITNESCVVDFAKKWNDCWSGFGGPTVVFSGSELAYDHAACSIPTSVSLASGDEVVDGGGARNVAVTVSRTDLDYAAISMTATPKASFQ